MDNCRHVWYESSEHLRICMLCRSIINLVSMKQMTQEEFEKLYPPPGEIGPIIFNDPPGFNQKK